jgi:hypothetical protein
MIMNRSEQLAKHVIEMIHEGARAEFRGQQSHGEYDFDLTYGNGDVAAVEVTKSTIQELELMLRKIGREFVLASACRNSWMVDALPSARIRLILKKVDHYLSAIEAEGMNEFFAPHDTMSESVSRILADLQINEGRILELPVPARIWVTCPSEKGSIVDANDLQRAIEAEATKGDNKRKLAKSQHPERHLFVYVDQLNCGPWQAMINRCIPEQPPMLPAEITHVWAAAEVYDRIIVWVAEPPNKWKSLGPIASMER